MSVEEKKIEQDVIIQHSEMGGRLFRNNTGTGWTGDQCHNNGKTMIITNPRPLRAGLVKGSSDTIGWTPVTITAEMVGKTLAIFTAFEVKGKIGKARLEQKIFIGNVAEANGITGIVRSKEDHTRIIKEWLAKISYT